MQLCWEICIRWHKKLKMLTTKSGLPTLNIFALTLWSMNNKNGNMEHGVFKPKAWLSITKTLNEQTGKSFTPKQVKDKHNRLRRKQKCGTSFWGIPGWGGMRQPKWLLLLIRCGLTWLRYIIFTTLILCIFFCNFLFHISMILMYILSF